MAFHSSFLPPAQLEFVVLGDTHFIVDAEAYAIEFDSVRQWPARAAHALRRAADLGADFTIHLGDLAEEPPAHEHHAESRRRAVECLTALELSPRFAAGNMDIGDKPDPTMFTPPVADATLAWFHAEFGPSWYSFVTGGCHFVVLNSQILNGPLPAADEQARWVEAELAAHSDERQFLFLHMPPFFVDEDEPDTGFYNSVDEPARSWLTALLREHRVEAVFCGHTHFRAFHHVDATRLYVCASTTTSRAGFYEAFTVAPPPEQGRNDPDKLGFYLVRVLPEGHRAHFVRTAGRTETAPDSSWADLVTRTSPDCSGSSLGLYLRTPLSTESAGAVAWPSVKRQRVRDDHPLLAAVELGVRHVRVPASDLRDPLQSRRLTVLRDEGVCLTAVWIDSPRLDLAGDLATLGVRPDTVELQLPGCVQPTDDVLHAVEAARRIHAGAVALAPLLPHERVPGRYHPRGRIGYRPEELAALGERLRDAGCAPLRAVAFLDPTRPPWDALRELSACGTCDSIGGIDAALPLPAGEDERLQVIAGSLCAAAAAGDVHLWLDPYVDLDRTNDLHRGLLDRLGNPGRAFHAARALNTLLVSASSWTWLDGDGSTFVLQSQGAELAIFTSTPADARLDALPAPGPGTLVCDLGAATVRAAGDLDTRSRALRDAALPCAVWHGPPFASAHRSP